MPSTGSLAKPPSSGGRPSCGGEPVGALGDGERRQGDRRQREVDGVHRDRRPGGWSAGCPGRGRAPPRRGSRSSRCRCRRSSPPGSRGRSRCQVGATPKCTLLTRTSGEKISTKPRITSSAWVAKSMTARSTLRRAASFTPTMLIADQQDDDQRAHDHVPRVLLERIPEDREVVGDEERRDGDRDDVVEHLGPAGPEADDLVEGVAGEARRAPGLGVAHRALGVGRGRRGEDQAGDDEDQRREPERERRRDAERVVDRGARRCRRPSRTAPARRGRARAPAAGGVGAPRHSTIRRRFIAAPAGSTGGRPSGSARSPATRRRRSGPPTTRAPPTPRCPRRRRSRGRGGR